MRGTEHGDSFKDGRPRRDGERLRMGTIMGTGAVVGGGGGGGQL